jgi:FG-GAP repeat
MGAIRARLRLFGLVMLLGSLIVVDAVWAQGGVSFTRRDFGVGVDPESIAVGDFNGDGHQDLATANRFPSTVSVLLGRGVAPSRPSQTWGWEWVLTLSPWVTSMAMAIRI